MTERILIFHDGLNLFINSSHVFQENRAYMLILSFIFKNRGCGNDKMMSNEEKININIFLIFK